MEAPEGWEAQNFAFFPRPPIFILSSLSWGLFVEFWWCLKAGTLEMCTVGLSGSRVMPCPRVWVSGLLGCRSSCP